MELSPGGWFSRMRGGGFALLDQGLFAVANFSVNVLLARWLPTSEYGAFTVAFSIYLLMAAFHTALITEPMTVFGAGKYASNFRHYLASVFRWHFRVSAAGGLVLVVTGGLLWRAGSDDVAGALVALGLASPFMLLLWIARRAFYVTSRISRASFGSALYLLMVLAVNYGLLQTETLSVSSALISLGLLSLAISALLIRELGPFRWTSCPKPIAEGVLTSHLQYGKWSSATAILMWIPGNIYYSLLSVKLGLDASAGLRAAMNLVLPMLQANVAISAFLIPRFVKISRDEGWSAMRRSMYSSLRILIGASTAYWVGLLLLRQEALRFLYHETYVDLGWLVAWLGFLPVSGAAVAVLGGAIRAIERPDRVFWSYLVGSIVALLAALTLSNLSAAAQGLLLSSVASAVFLLVSFHRLEPVPQGR